MSTNTTQPKQTKPVSAQALYKRLQSQLDASFFQAAIKTTGRREHNSGKVESGVADVY